jgi:hypothetical protein
MCINQNSNKSSRIQTTVTRVIRKASKAAKVNVRQDTTDMLLPCDVSDFVFNIFTDVNSTLFALFAGTACDVDEMLLFLWLVFIISSSLDVVIVDVNTGVDAAAAAGKTAGGRKLSEALVEESNLWSRCAAAGDAVIESTVGNVAAATSGVAENVCPFTRLVGVGVASSLADVLSPVMRVAGGEGDVFMFIATVDVANSDGIRGITDDADGAIGMPVDLVAFSVEGTTSEDVEDFWVAIEVVELAIAVVTSAAEGTIGTFDWDSDDNGDVMAVMPCAVDIKPIGDPPFFDKSCANSFSFKSSSFAVSLLTCCTPAGGATADVLLLDFERLNGVSLVDESEGGDNCLLGVNVVIGITNGSVVPLLVIGCPLTRDSLPIETSGHVSIIVCHYSH